MTDDSPSAHIGSAQSTITNPGRVARNLILTGVSQSWSIVVSLVAVPVVVHGIGPAAYGVFVLAWLVAGYAGLFELGLTPATTRAIAIHHALGDHDALQRTISTARIALIGIAIPGAVALFLITAVGSRLVLHLPRGLENDAIFVFGVVAVAFAFNTSMTIYSVVAVAMQQFRLVAVQTILVSTTTAVAQIALVRSGLGLRWLVVTSFAIFALSLLIFIRPAKRLLSGTSFRPRLHAETLRELIGFGSQRIAGQMLLQVAYGVDRFVIALLLPINALTYYSVPLSITQKFVLLQSTIGQAFFPSASELHGVKNDEQLRFLYLGVMKLTVAVTIPAAILVAAFSWPILDAWLGAQFADQSSRILTILALAYGLVALVVIPAQASDATGHVRWTLLFASIAAFVTASTTVVLVPKLGAVGAGVGVAIGVGAVGLVFSYVVQRRLLGLRLAQVLGHVVIGPGIAGAGLAFYCWFVVPRVRGVLWTLGALLVGLLVYGGLTVLTGTWSKQEWSLLRALFRGLSRHPQRADRAPSDP